MPEFRAGQIIPLRYKSREIKAIIIDPNGLGSDKPTIGMGFRGMDRQLNVPVNTLSQRVIQNENGQHIKLPSGKHFRMFQIPGEDGNDYQAIEASDWVEIAKDWAQNLGSSVSLPGMA